MEAKKTAGLAMTKSVARDCRSGLLETTSNRPWRTAKMNTHQLLQSRRKKLREKEETERWQVVVKGNTNDRCFTGPINLAHRSIVQKPYTPAYQRPATRSDEHLTNTRYNVTSIFVSH